MERIASGVEKLFGYVAEGLAVATDAFVRNDRRLASSLLDREPLIDALHLDIEESAQATLIEHRDLSSAEIRFLVSVLRIVPELERSADLVEHIALRTGVFSTPLPADVSALIAQMGDIATTMWGQAARAWSGRMPSVAGDLRDSDDVLDDLHVQLTERLSALPLLVSEAIELGLVARFFERLGDHAVNVTERLSFLVSLPAAG